MDATLESRLGRSENVVAREIEGELILIPLVSGIADLETDIMALNGTGRAIWERIDGHSSLQHVVEEMEKVFEGERQEIEAHVLGFSSELLRRGLLVAVP